MTDQWLPGVGEKTTEAQATFAGGGHLHHPDCWDGFTSVYMDEYFSNGTF